MTVGPFTDEIIGWAQAAQQKWQIPASLSLSAAKVESNLGKATPPGSNNWFGIKDSHGVVTSTREETAGGVSYTIQAGFMMFATPADGFMYYGHLLGLGAPYHDMVTRFVNSPRGSADVQALSRALTGVYATALNYGSALIAVQQLYGLYQFDKLNGVPMADATTAAPVPATSSTPAPVTTPPRVTPTVAQPIRIDWGSFVDQLLANEAPIIEAAISGGINLALAQIPMGSMIEMFIGPTVINQYIQQGLTALEGVLANQSLTIPASNMLVTTVANMFIANEPKLAAFLGPNLDTLIKAAVAKLNLPS